MSNIIGSFIYKDDGDGCLSSKYINTRMNTPLVEACKIISAPINAVAFEGHYSTVWLDSLQQSEQGELEIKRTGEDYYDLKWVIEGKLAFAGQGMLYNGLLIGSYWSV